MRALFLIPGDSSTQIQAFAAVAAVIKHLQAEVHVVCPPKEQALWGIHPGAIRTVPFNFEAASLADWTNLLGAVREPDFQLCFNRAGGRQVNLMLSMSHIPTRIATSGFSATETVQGPETGWGSLSWQAMLRPVGVPLEAETYTLKLPQPDLEAVAASLPTGDGPLLLLAPSGDSADWPTQCWQELPEVIRQRLAGLRTLDAGTGSVKGKAARIAVADVVLASDPLSIELALLLGIPLVALGRPPESLPDRDGVRGVEGPGLLANLPIEDVLTALGFS